MKSSVAALALVCLCLVSALNAQSCVKAIGFCVGSICPDATTSCISGICCVTDSAANCNDVEAASFCTQAAPQCYDATVGAAIRAACPSTCHACNGASAANATATTVAPASASCVDLVGPNGVSDCPARQYLCNNPTYYTLMTEQCPKTCNRC